MSERNDQLVDFNEARAIDLYIGASTLDVDGRSIKVATFAAQVLNSSYFNVLMDNVRELEDNTWTITIDADPKTLGDRVGEAMKITNFADYKEPSCTVRVETIKQQEVEYFDQNLVELEVEIKQGTKLLFPLYHFTSDQFEGRSAQAFIKALQEHGYWRLVIQDVNTKAAYVVHNVHAKIGSGAMGRKSESRRERRRKK